MLPLIALLIGLAAQQCLEMAAGLSLQRLRRHYFIGMGIVCAGIGLWIVAATVFGLGPLKGQQSPGFAAVFAIVAAAATAIVLWTSARSSPATERLGILTLAAFLGLTYCGAVVNTFIATRHPIADEVAAMAARLPEGVELVSIGPVDDVFLYYYGRPIRQLPAAEGIGRKDRAWTWFCMGNGPNLPRFDPSYEPIGKISVEPAYNDHPENVVIIGRRIDDATAGNTADKVR